MRDNKKVDEDLEKQFTDGITNKMLNTQHHGLGASSRPAAQNTRKTFDDDVIDNNEVGKNVNEAIKANSVTKVEVPVKVAEAYTSFNPAAEAKLKFKKMSFVKSSS